MGMTRGQMLRSISSKELMEQMAHDRLTLLDKDRAESGSEVLAAARASVSGQLAKGRR